MAAWATSRALAIHEMHATVVWAFTEAWVTSWTLAMDWMHAPKFRRHMMEPEAAWATSRALAMQLIYIFDSCTIIPREGLFGRLAD